jgi:hypothetical protein
LTPDSIQQKYAQTVASTWITPGCVQFLGEEKRFHTAWVNSRLMRRGKFRPIDQPVDADEYGSFG